jgi:hypothetical protein
VACDVRVFPYQGTGASFPLKVNFMFKIVVMLIVGYTSSGVDRTLVYPQNFTSSECARVKENLEALFQDQKAHGVRWVKCKKVLSSDWIDATFGH